MAEGLEAAEAFITPNPEPGEDASRMQYVLEMLPYPSGDLHMGHVKNYTIGDALCHQRRRHGLRVLHPMGYDAFGLPAENAAIREGRHPRDVTNDNIAAIRKQMKRMGWSIDWSRELSTAEPEYYRWTQWIFLLLFERGLANKREAPVNWCPVDQTVLANEQVIDGHCERCGALVESRTLAQWYFSITDYAQRLLDDMELLEDWPERVLSMQRNWIGRSEGAEVLFHQRDLDAVDQRLHDAARHALRRDVLRPGAGASADPARWSRARIARRGAGLRAPPLGSPRGGARAGQGQDGRLHRAARSRTRSRARRSRSGSPTTSCWATAPARSWPCPRTTSATSSSRRPTGCRSCRSSRLPTASCPKARPTPRTRPTRC